jgi:hypothetical protein
VKIETSLVTLACTAAAFLVAGCAGPFVEVPPAHPVAGAVRATFCGNSGMRASTVIERMDGPPLGETGSQPEPPKEVVVCVLVENKGQEPVKIDRSRVYLKTPHGSETPLGDKEDDKFVVPAGTSRKFQVAFHYSQMLSGEDARVDFDKVASIKDRPIELPAIVLRKR